MAHAAKLLGATPDTVVDGITKRLDEIDALRREIKVLRGKAAAGQASELAGRGRDGVVVARVDGLTPGSLRELALAVRQQPDIRAVVLAGESDTGGVSLVSAVSTSSGLEAGALIKDAARAVGGGGGGKGDVATAGGKNAAGIDDALAIAAKAAGLG